MECSRCPNPAQINHRYCRVCQRDYDRKRHQAKKALRNKQIRQYRMKNKEWMDNLKASTPCTDCSHKFPAIVMEWDHIDPTTKQGNVSDILLHGGSRAKVEKEIEQCELVCANCHRLRTLKRSR